MKEEVVLVNSNDEEIGVMEKLEAHHKAMLHRAFSVLLFNDKNEFLLQKRASEKYHCANMWTNTCCSHPRAGESLNQAVNRRLKEEMGIICETQKLFDFIYKVELEDHMFEHEFDHVFVGQFNGTPIPNPNEVEDWKYISLASLTSDLNQNPAQYTPWFKLILKEIESKKLEIV